MSERKYALVKLHAGDYILPANDGKTLWRIARYEEGPSYGLEDWPRDRMVWGTWRWNRLFQGRIDRAEAEDWSNWDLDSTCLATRSEAIAEVVGSSARSGD